MASVTEIIDNVLRLPKTDRTYLAKKLLESLDETEIFTDEEAATVERRSRENSQKTVAPLSLHQLKKTVGERIR